MATIGMCQYYQRSAGLGMGLGNCELGDQAICEGDVKFCERPDDLKARLKEKAAVLKKDDRQPEKRSGYNVLVVDDEEPIRRLIVAVLSKRNHMVVTAANGREALSKAFKYKFDAVITDIVMPEMNGIALTKELLSLYPQLPVLVMTGHSKEYPTATALAAGARDFIAIPFEIEDFILRFEKMMHDHEAFSRLETMQNQAAVGTGKRTGG